MNHQYNSDSTAMWISTLLTTALFALVAGVCHNYEKDYYTDLGCTPAMVGDDGCPKSYDCSMIGKRSQSKCHYRGREYDEGHNLQQDDNCLVGCRCATSYPDNKKAFTCVSVECPELFIGPPPPGCYRTYEHGKCCHIDEVCVSDQTPEQKAAKPICQHNSKEYQVGQKFYPDEAPCLQCICQAGFNGTLVEPYCKKINCNLELHYGRRIADGCVPVYYGENDCCPIGWRCPEKSDSVVSVKTDSSTPNSDLQCQFGSVKMQVGEKLSSSGEWPDTECACRVPPHPVCIQKYEEYTPPPTPPQV